METASNFYYQLILKMFFIFNQFAQQEEKFWLKIVT